MSDRKVLNKYYPPDYDPSKIPRMRLPSSRQIQSRIMLPMSIQCARCGDFIYKGKKFNARKEAVVGEAYLGITRWRFYFRCPSCLNEITFKTDPQRSGYEVEMGATRNYEPWKAKADEEALQKKEREEVDADVMKKLERQSREGKVNEDMAEVIEELRVRNSQGDRITLEELRRVHVEEKQKGEEEEDQRRAREAFAQRGVGPRPQSPQRRRAKAMTVEALDCEVDDEADDVKEGRDERKEGVEEKVEEEGGAETEEFARERRELSASGLSFAALTREDEGKRANRAQQEERKEEGGMLSGLRLSVKRKAAGVDGQGQKQQKGEGSESGVAIARLEAASSQPVTTARTSAPPLSSLLSAYDSDSD